MIDESTGQIGQIKPEKRYLKEIVLKVGYPENLFFQVCGELIIKDFGEKKIIMIWTVPSLGSRCNVVRQPGYYHVLQCILCQV